MNDIDLTTARILIVDDQTANVELLRDMLQLAGYHELLGLTDPTEVEAFCTSFQPDLILLDLLMPEMDGFAVLERLAPLLAQHIYLPVLVLTADITDHARQRALAVGARDFVTKPFNVAEVLLRIKNLLEVRMLYTRLRGRRESLERVVTDRTRDLQEAQIETLSRLARAAEYRDDETGQHTHRVGEIAAEVARALGLAEEFVETIRLAAPLHDIGKIGIRDAILLKPARLTPDEMAVMQTHTTLGANLLAGGQTPLLRLAEEIALTHHERWDGTGYPQRLIGDGIPLAGRIVAVADVFDALTHARTYKPAWPREAALTEIEGQRGRQFDPEVVEAFLRVLAR
jgi:putative two-component system response regulator